MGTSSGPGPRVSVARVQLSLGIEKEETRSIAQLYAEVTATLDARWGRAHQVWVTGEVQKYADHRSGHCYLDLVDPAASGRREVPTLKVKCWRSTWGPIRASIKRAGLSIEEGSIVRLRGYVDLYAARGELSFIVTSVDVEALRLATLGEHARRRAELLERLAAEAILEANRSRRMPLVPLTVGLVASKGTEGYNDFVGMLVASGFAFRVTLARATVQGSRAPAEVSAAVGRLVRAGAEVICIVRGGGSQTDLAAFDDERVARAIVAAPVPVLTGIGHTGDVAVADLVAFASHRTPTACAEALVALVRSWYAENVGLAARRLADAAASLLEEHEDLLGQHRRHAAVVARHRVERAQDHLAHAARAAVRCAPQAMDRAGEALSARANRLAPIARHRLESAATALAARRSLLAAYDPARLLERGWTLTTDESGRPVAFSELTVGAQISTRFARGVARSSVTGLEEGE